jgi:hypothetical protein
MRLRHVVDLWGILYDLINLRLSRKRILMLQYVQVRGRKREARKRKVVEGGLCSGKVIT